MMIKRIEKTYKKALDQGYSKKVATIICILGILGAIFGLIVGYLGLLAIEGAILMWVFNLLAPLFNIAIVLTFWQGVAIVVALMILKGIICWLIKR